MPVACNNSFVLTHNWQYTAVNRVHFHVRQVQTFKAY